MQGARTPAWTPVGVIDAASGAAEDWHVRERSVMSVLWIIVLCLVALVWVLSVVDIVRQHYAGRPRPRGSPWF